jgi:hypothetical protein
MAVTWNPADAQTTVVLSNGNLDTIGTASGSFACVRATLSHNAGAWYFEQFVVLGGGTTAVPGFADATTTLAGTSGSQFPGLFPNSGGISGTTAWNSGITRDIANPAITTNTNDVHMYAIDFTNGKAWFGLNGTWQASVTPVVGGAGQVFHWTPPMTIFPCVGNDNSSKSRLHTLAANQAFAAPSGFSAWEAAAGGGADFRRSLSAFGARAGSRQVVGVS